MPTSQRRIDAARANALKSTGPKTPAGKAAVSGNALKHGLTAKTVVLSTETAEEFEAELDHYLAHFQPQGKPEFDLVRQLAAAHWRMVRYAAIETALLENFMQIDEARFERIFGDLDNHRRLASAFHYYGDGNAALSLLNRYQARLQRDYLRILAMLTALQAARSERNAKLPNKAKPALLPVPLDAANSLPANLLPATLRAPIALEPTLSRDPSPAVASLATPEPAAPP